MLIMNRKYELEIEQNKRKLWWNDLRKSQKIGVKSKEKLERSIDEIGKLKE